MSVTDDGTEEYKRRRHNIARLVHWKLNEHQSEGVMEKEKFKILWDVTIQCDHIMEARRSGILVEKENNKVIIMDI